MLWARIKDWWEWRQIEKEIAYEIKSAALRAIMIQREAHEMYRLGECTILVMSSKEELQSRLIQLESDSRQTAEERKQKASEAWLTVGGEERE